MLEGEVLVSELLSVDGLAAGAIPRGEVAALAVAMAMVGVVVIVRRWSIVILVAALEFTWHMNCGMTLWKEEPLKPKPFSPVHSARKFSAVLGGGGGGGGRGEGRITWAPRRAAAPSPPSPGAPRRR